MAWILVSCWGDNCGNAFGMSAYCSEPKTVLNQQRVEQRRQFMRRGHRSVIQTNCLAPFFFFKEMRKLGLMVERHLLATLLLLLLLIVEP